MVEKVGVDNIVVCGDFVGGGFIFVFVLKWCDEVKLLLVGFVLFFFWFDIIVLGVD